MLLFGLESTKSSDYGSRSGIIGIKGSTYVEELYLPYGVTSIKQPVSKAIYSNRLYIAGGYSYQLVVDENMTVWKQGILPPVEGPDIGGAASGGSGDFAYLSWWDDYTQERSPLSPPTEIGAGTRIWQNLPSRPPDDVHISEGTLNFENDPGDGEFYWTDDPRTRTFYLRPGDEVTIADPSSKVDHVKEVLSERIFTTSQGGFLWPGGPGSGDKTGLTMAALPFTRATHLELWVSVAGGLPRQVMRVDIGTEVITETTSAQNLGETFIDTFQRFPFCSINAIYHDRQLLAGDPDAPDTLYISQLFFPERYGGQSFRTRNGEKIVSIIGTRDYALIMTDRSSYILQGYTDNDLTFTVADPNIGAITHAGNQVVHGMPFVWTDAGPYLFNGSWHPMSPENKYYLRECLFQETGETTYNTPDLFRDLTWLNYWGMHQPDEQFRFWQGSRDPNWNCWITGGTIVMDYTPVAPQAGGSFSVARMSLDQCEAIDVQNGQWNMKPIHPEVATWMRDSNEEKGAMWMAFEGVYWGGANNWVWFCRMDDAPIEYNTDFVETYEYTAPNGSGGLQLVGVATPYVPFDFVVEFPFHGHQDMDSGAYEREGRVYRQVWLHALMEGSETRFWSNAPILQEPANVWTLEAKQQSWLYLYSGEETSIQVLRSPAYRGTGRTGVQQIDLTESLGSRGEFDIGATYGPGVPPDPFPFPPLADPKAAAGRMVGIHATPPLTGVSGRGLNALFLCRYTGAKIRILGMGGVYGAGPHNVYGVDPWS